MTNLSEFPWFNEPWATTVRDTTRRLVRVYAEAYETVQSSSTAFHRVELTGIRHGRALWVIKPLLRDAVIKHIQVNLSQMTVLRLRAYTAQRPSAAELKLRVKLTAPIELVEKAKKELQASQEVRERIQRLLNEADTDVKELHELVSDYREMTSTVIRNALRLFRRILPVGFAGWVITQFGRLHGMPVWQATVFSLLILTAYHAMGLLLLPFHDAGYRKDIFFNGYIGRFSDGLNPLFPPVNRLENEFYENFKTQPPVVISWDELAPLLHYTIAIGLVVLLVSALPFDPKARAYAIIFGILLIGQYLMRLKELWQLLKVRYSGRSIIELAFATFQAFDWVSLWGHPEQQSEEKK